jgi:hypothetical protein
MDSCSAPPEIAAHADLAKVRLEDWLASLGAAGAISSPFTISTREDFVGH